MRTTFWCRCAWSPRSVARRVRPLLARVGSLLDPPPPVRTLLARAEPEAAAEKPGRRDSPEEEGNRDPGEVVA